MQAPQAQCLRARRGHLLGLPSVVPGKVRYEAHEDIGEDLDPICAAFTQYFAADVKNWTLKTLADKKEKKRPAESTGDRSHKRGRRPEKYSSCQGRQRDRCYHHDGNEQ